MAPATVRLWDALSFETQVTLIQAGLVDPSLVIVTKRREAGPRLVLTESPEELERIMKETPHYTIFMETPRGLRSPKLKDE